ncbi:hypothetical protein HG535_0E03520 [Zygotorulaspora mrakii]|uniref:AB hydrolase-1 domain-containing protein n=1 Tax=Zygotorulaspora mrakii TaxID=42260 RepID=A0A7H9B3M9_ZYGMR|nr:uncharacterized protein HG535_0E03520 [Zygotorulaspora mrakii]QLG73268.1 hypothetical protein HG535_0E03520 [Zygotorulaspora mrakii]
MLLKRLLQSRALPRRPIVDLAYTIVKPATTDEKYLKREPVLITLHGLFGTKSMFGTFSKTLSDNLGYTVCNVDLRDHGASPQAIPFDYVTLTKDLISFIKKRFGTQRQINIIGFSLGGRVALLSSLCNLVNINKCVSIDFPPYTIPRVDDVLTENFDSILKIISREIKITKGTKTWKKELLNLLNELPANKIDKGHPALYFANGFFLNSNNNLPFDKHLDKDPYIDFYLPLKQLPTILEDVKIWPDLYGKDNSDHFFKTVTDRSVLFMRALQSPFFTDDSSLLYKHFPRAKLVSFDCGHNMAFEKPKETVEYIVNYLKE